MTILVFDCTFSTFSILNIFYYWNYLPYFMKKNFTSLYLPRCGFEVAWEGMEDGGLSLVPRCPSHPPDFLCDATYSHIPSWGDVILEF